MDVLVLLRLLFDITNPVGELLEVVLVISVLLLQLYLESSKQKRLLRQELGNLTTLLLFCADLRLRHED